MLSRIALAARGAAALGMGMAFAAAAICVLMAVATPAHAGCVWRGTAPICAGNCNSNEIEVKRLNGPYVAESEPNFGKGCVSGTKALCCTRCPQGLVWRDSHYLDTVCVTPAERDGAKAPPGSVKGAKRKKGPIEAPSPIEGTEVNKGPIANPEQPYVTKRKTGPFVQD
jgi:hypothetical protein